MQFIWWLRNVYVSDVIMIKLTHIHWSFASDGVDIEEEDKVNDYKINVFFWPKPNGSQFNQTHRRHLFIHKHKFKKHTPKRSYSITQYFSAYEYILKYSLTIHSSLFCFCSGQHSWSLFEWILSAFLFFYWAVNQSVKLF